MTNKIYVSYLTSQNEIMGFYCIYSELKQKLIQYDCFGSIQLK